MDCHRRAEERMARRPKMRKRRVGLRMRSRDEMKREKEMGNTHEAFMRPSTIGAERPLGRMAGARAIKTLTF